MPSASLITVTYNSAEALTTFWSDRPQGDVEWIVIDNNSTDDSAQIATALGARVVRLRRNVGFSAANNVGADLARGEVLGFLNPDVTPSADGISGLCRLAIDRRALVAPQLMNRDGSLQENGRGAPFPHRKLAHMFAPRSQSSANYVRHVKAGILQVVWVMGAAVFMTREVFDQIGGWDSGFFIYYEDSDICIRALRQGIPTLVDGDINWVHGWGRETVHNRSAEIWRMEFRSAARFYRQHPYCIASVGWRGRKFREIERAAASGIGR